MSHKDTKSAKENLNKEVLGLLCTLSVFVVNLIPLHVEACPRCMDATPYKTGLLWAVAFLLPIPFLLAGGVVFWIVRHSKPGNPSK